MEPVFETDMLSAVPGLKSTLLFPSRVCPLLFKVEVVLVLGRALNSCFGEPDSTCSSAGVESTSSPFDFL